MVGPFLFAVTVWTRHQVILGHSGLKESTIEANKECGRFLSGDCIKGTVCKNDGTGTGIKKCLPAILTSYDGEYCKNACKHGSGHYYCLSQKDTFVKCKECSKLNRRTVSDQCVCTEEWCDCKGARGDKCERGQTCLNGKCNDTPEDRREIPTTGGNFCPIPWRESNNSNLQFGCKPNTSFFMEIEGEYCKDGTYSLLTCKDGVVKTTKNLEFEKLVLRHEEENNLSSKMKSKKSEKKKLEVCKKECQNNTSCKHFVMKKLQEENEYECYLLNDTPEDSEKIKGTSGQFIHGPFYARPGKIGFWKRFGKKTLYAAATLIVNA